MDTLTLTGTVTSITVNGVAWGPPAAPAPAPPPPPPVTTPPSTPVYGPVPTTPPAGAILLDPSMNIASMVNAAATGATFYFQPGIYRGASIIPKTGQTFIGALGAVLNGSTVIPSWAASGALWVASNQTQRGTPHPNAWFLTGVLNRPESLFLDGMPLKAVASQAAVVPGTFFFDLVASKIYIADNPAGHTLEATTKTYAFTGTAANVTIQNLVIEKYMPMIQHGPIDGSGLAWIVQNNEIRWNYAAGASLWTGGTASANYIHDNGQLGIGGQGTVTVIGNEIARNGAWSGIDPTWEAGGFKASGTAATVSRLNYIHDNIGSGIWGDIAASNWTIANNLLVGNSINGIAYEISSGAKIQNNTLIGNGWGDTRFWGWGGGIQIQNSQGCTVNGNRIDMTGSNGKAGIILIQQNRTDGTGAANTTGNTMSGNTIVCRDASGTNGGWSVDNPASITGGGNVWSGNSYYMTDGSARFSWPGQMAFAGFKAAAKETGTIGPALDTSGWRTDWRTFSG